MSAKVINTAVINRVTMSQAATTAPVKRDTHSHLITRLAKISMNARVTTSVQATSSVVVPLVAISVTALRDSITQWEIAPISMNVLCHRITVLTVVPAITPLARTGACVRMGIFKSMKTPVRTLMNAILGKTAALITCYALTLREATNVTARLATPPLLTATSLHAKIWMSV